MVLMLFFLKENGDWYEGVEDWVVIIRINVGIVIIVCDVVG